MKKRKLKKEIDKKGKNRRWTKEQGESSIRKIKCSQENHVTPVHPQQTDRQSDRQAGKRSDRHTFRINV